MLAPMMEAKVTTGCQQIRTSSRHKLVCFCPYQRIWHKFESWFKMAYSMEWGVLESHTARCINCRLVHEVPSRKQRRGVHARMGCVDQHVAAGGTNRAATVPAPANNVRRETFGF